MCFYMREETSKRPFGLTNSKDLQMIFHRKELNSTKRD